MDNLKLETSMLILLLISLFGQGLKRASRLGYAVARASG